MSSRSSELSPNDIRPDDTAISHGVPSTATSSVAPIEHTVQEFKEQTEKSRAASRQSRNEEHPTHKPQELNHSKATNDNGLASPSITPPSAHNRFPQSQRNASPISAYHHGGPLTHHQREQYTPPDRRAAPPMSPASISPSTSLNVTSTVEYLLQSAATESSPASSPDASPPRQPHLLTHFEAELSDLALDDAEEDAINGLFCLRTDHGKRPPRRPGHPTTLTPPRLTAPATDALSTLPPDHAAKMSCCHSLLALRKRDAREEERSYRRLLIARDLTGDQDLYSDADTLVDEEEAGRRHSGFSARDPAPFGSSSSSSSSNDDDGEQRRSTHTAIFPPRRRRRRHHALIQSPTKKQRPATAAATKNPQSSLDDAREKLNTTAKKVIPAPRAPLPSPSPSPSPLHARAHAHALGYRREKGRKRAGTAVRSRPTPMPMPSRYGVMAGERRATVSGQCGTTPTPGQGPKALKLTMSRAGRTVKPSRRVSG